MPEKTERHVCVERRPILERKSHLPQWGPMKAEEDRRGKTQNNVKDTGGEKHCYKKRAKQENLKGKRGSLGRSGLNALQTLSGWPESSCRSREKHLTARMTLGKGHSRRGEESTERREPWTFRKLLHVTVLNSPRKKRKAQGVAADYGWKRRGGGNLRTNRKLWPGK